MNVGSCWTGDVLDEDAEELGDSIASSVFVKRLWNLQSTTTIDISRSNFDRLGLKKVNGCLLGEADDASILAKEQQEALESKTYLKVFVYRQCYEPRKLSAPREESFFIHEIT